MHIYTWTKDLGRRNFNSSLTHFEDLQIFYLVVVFVLYGEQIKQPIAGGDYRWRFFTTWGGADHQRWFEAGRESWYMLYNVSMLLEFKTSNVVALTLNAIWLWLRNKKIVSHENYLSWYVINVVFMIFLLFFSLFFSFPPPKDSYNFKMIIKHILKCQLSCV